MKEVILGLASYLILAGQVSYKIKSFPNSFQAVSLEVKYFWPPLPNLYVFYSGLIRQQINC